MSQYLPGLHEEDADITLFARPEPQGVIKVRGKLTERRKERITKAFNKGKRKGWRWHYQEYA